MDCFVTILWNEIHNLNSVAMYNKHIDEIAAGIICKMLASPINQGLKNSRKFAKLRREFHSFRHLPVHQSSLHQDISPAHWPRADKLPVFLKASFLVLRTRSLRKLHLQRMTRPLLKSVSIILFPCGHKNPVAAPKDFLKSCPKRTALFSSSCLEFPGLELWLSSYVQSELDWFHVNMSLMFHGQAISVSI